MNEQNSWDEYCDHIDALVATGQYASRYNAGLEVKRRYPHLAKVQPPGIGSAQVGLVRAGAAGSSSAEAQLDALAKRIAAERRCTYAQAYVAALNADASLYLRYLQEHEAKLDAGARRG
jgi:hypothetical protein